MGSGTFDDRWLRPEPARFVAIVVLVMVIVLLTIQFASNREGETALGPRLGADYAEFYAVGTLLNREPGRRLFDLELQDGLLHQTLPGLPAEEHLPFVYPPFLGPIFRPMARLPFALSFATWLALSMGCYAGSVGLMLRGRTDLDGRSRWTAWLLALSFVPFSMECWMGGQLSALGCLAVASALASARLGRPIVAGLVLCLLCYKPTLPLLILPLLAIGGRWKTLAGFAAGAVALAVGSWMVAGVDGSGDFIGLMMGYGRHGGSVGEGFRTFKYVDLRAFFRLMGVGSVAVGPLAALIAGPALVGLAWAWRKGDARLAWSAALCWTPVLNVYGPIYDVSLVVPGLLMADEALRARGLADLRTFRRLLAFVYISGLFSSAMARGIGWQPMTVALASMGTFLIRESLRIVPDRQSDHFVEKTRFEGDARS